MNENDVINLRRCAEAVRNLIGQRPLNGAWADWVPRDLDRLADRINESLTEGS